MTNVTPGSILRNSHMWHHHNPGPVSWWGNWVTAEHLSHSPKVTWLLSVRGRIWTQVQRLCSNHCAAWHWVPLRSEGAIHSHQFETLSPVKEVWVVAEEKEPKVPAHYDCHQYPPGPRWAWSLGSLFKGKLVPQTHTHTHKPSSIAQLGVYLVATYLLLLFLSFLIHMME